MPQDKRLNQRSHISMVKLKSRSSKSMRHQQSKSTYYHISKGTEISSETNTIYKLDWYLTLTKLGVKVSSSSQLQQNCFQELRGNQTKGLWSTKYIPIAIGLASTTGFLRISVSSYLYRHTLRVRIYKHRLRGRNKLWV